MRLTRFVSLALASAALMSVMTSSCRKKSHAPDAPVLLDVPSVCAKDSVYAFRVTAVDPDEDSISLRIQWGDIASDWSTWVASGDTILMTHGWSDTGTYELQAQARDNRYHASGWSAVQPVRVINMRPPGPPNRPAQPLGPDRGRQDSMYSFSSFASDPDGDRVSIRLSWGNGDTSDWSGLVAGGDTVSVAYAWPAPDSYLVCAQARDTAGGLSLWSTALAVDIWPPDTMVKWRFPIYGPSAFNPSVRSSPALGADGTIYIGSPDSFLYAINPDGTLKWRYQVAGLMGLTSPAIGEDGTIYTGSSHALLYALNPDGSLRWSYPEAGHLATSPALAADGTIYLSSHSSRFYAVNPDGTAKWRYLTGASSYSSPAVAADGAIYFGDEGGYVNALNPDSTLQWRYVVVNDVSSSPAITADGTIIVGCEDDAVYAFNPDSTVKWRYITGGAVRFSSPAVGPDGTIHVGSHDDSLHAINPDGTPKWRYPTGGNIYSSPAIAADGAIYFGSEDSCLHAVNADGTRRWFQKTGGSVNSSPAIAPDGTIYVASYDGYLYALKGTSPLADSPWPKFHHDNRNTGRVGGP